LSPEVNATARVNIKCTHNDNGLDIMLWYKQPESGMMKLIGYDYFGSDPIMEKEFKDDFEIRRENTLTGALIIRSVTPSHSAVYFCSTKPGHCDTDGYKAYLGEGTRFTVLEDGLDVTPVDEENIKLFAPSSKQCKNRVGQKTKTLVCLATHFYPDHVNVTWEVNGEQNKPNIIESTDAAAAKRNGDRYYSITSRLTVPSEVWTNPENNFTCIVDFFDGTKNIQTRKSISGVKGICSGFFLSFQGKQND
uniref:Ig-like domain-containing protein n=1 Tax=Echeneis naucrates TaxID=173247 RepID=A0A665W5F1_ECHNA